MEKFQIGDLVAWDSQSQGSWKEKRGTIVAILPAMTWPHEGLASIPLPARLMFDGKFPRDHESYFVAVKPSERSIYRIYWPRVASLRIYSVDDDDPANDPQPPAPEPYDPIQEENDRATERWQTGEGMSDY
jgi:hypothetical protein